MVSSQSIWGGKRKPLPTFNSRREGWLPLKKLQRYAKLLKVQFRHIIC